MHKGTFIVNLHLGDVADQEAFCVSLESLFYIQMISPISARTETLRRAWDPHGFLLRTMLLVTAIPLLTS